MVSVDSLVFLISVALVVYVGGRIPLGLMGCWRLGVSVV